MVNIKAGTLTITHDSNGDAVTMLGGNNTLNIAGGKRVLNRHLRIGESAVSAGTKNVVNLTAGTIISSHEIMIGSIGSVDDAAALREASLNVSGGVHRIPRSSVGKANGVLTANAGDSVSVSVSVIGARSVNNTFTGGTIEAHAFDINLLGTERMEIGDGANKTPTLKFINTVPANSSFNDGLRIRSDGVLATSATPHTIRIADNDLLVEGALRIGDADPESPGELGNGVGTLVASGPGMRLSDTSVLTIDINTPTSFDRITLDGAGLRSLGTRRPAPVLRGLRGQPSRREHSGGHRVGNGNQIRTGLRVWVMDRGMVSESNLAFLRERKARYLVGTPKSWLRAHEQTLLEQSDWQQAQYGLKVRLVEHPDGEPGERYVLCRSGARAEKERAMLQRQSDRLTEELHKVDAWLVCSPQTDREAVGRRIGRHLGKYPAAASILVAEVVSDAQGRAVGLRVYSRLDAGQKNHRQKGAYLLRTNCEETDPALLWRWYIQLTQAEAAFRAAKRDLGLRRVFHHREDRVQAHILFCFLALALWRTLAQWMQSKRLGTCARQLIKEMAGIKSVDVIVPVKRAGVRTQLRLRVVNTPEPAATQLLAHLGLRLPQGSRLIGDVVPKITAWK